MGKQPNVSSSNFEPCPPGLHRAVCVDVVDLGLVQTAYGLKDKLALVFVCDVRDDEGQPVMTSSGKPFLVQRRFTNSMNEKATLRQCLEAWRGKQYSAADLASFTDFDVLIGRNATLNVVHSEPKADGTVYANIANILPPNKQLPQLKIPSDYVRKQDRPAAGTVVSDSDTFNNPDADLNF